MSLLCNSSVVFFVALLSRRKCHILSTNLMPLERIWSFQKLLIKYGFCKKLLQYKWTSGQLNTFFRTFWTGLLCVVPVQKVREKVFNWWEVHLYRCNFLQNPYFKQMHSVHANFQTSHMFSVFDQTNFHKVRTFWKGHKNLSPTWFDIY